MKNVYEYCQKRKFMTDEECEEYCQKRKLKHCKNNKNHLMPTLDRRQFCDRCRAKVNSRQNERNKLIRKVEKEIFYARYPKLQFKPIKHRHNNNNNNNNNNNSDNNNNNS
eukprot:60850_1